MSLAPADVLSVRDREINTQRQRDTHGHRNTWMHKINRDVKRLHADLQSDPEQVTRGHKSRQAGRQTDTRAHTPTMNRVTRSLTLKGTQILHTIHTEKVILRNAQANSQTATGPQSYSHTHRTT